ncbi:hypothetical protein GF359_00600 [candidate division WOR-3 bacterium]|uniref:Class I SAM-dependent methyltransferase n=1 Tax=candidate division WOR-3 bacterium TaxID=2052148 RepID=A0A9D5K7I2_UNCW3|nr:hypothetical protein [candidate division WOR-3 bacterium]MBD3363692.1 hypothetical protein [candidate division WOR-3 bacterium]
MPLIGLTQRIENLLTFLEIQGVRTVLQIGAESGESVEIFSSKGFDVTVFSLDSGRSAEISNKLDEKNLKANLINIPSQIKISYYDFALAYNNIYKRTHQELRDRLTVFLAYLKEDGFFYLTLASTRNSNYGKGKEVEKNTYESGGKITHYCDAVEIVNLFRHVEIIDLRNEEQEEPGSFHWHVLGRNRDPYPPEEEEASTAEDE